MDDVCDIVRVYGRMVARAARAAREQEELAARVAALRDFVDALDRLGQGFAVQFVAPRAACAAGCLATARKGW